MTMNWRYRFVFIILTTFFILVIFRLFYWQVVKAEMLSELAISQYEGLIKIIPVRGRIKTSDGFEIGSNKVSYLLFANPKEVKDKNNIIDRLSSTIEIDESSASASLSRDKLWVSLKSGVSVEQKSDIEKFDLPGIGFEQKFNRFYPEASMAATLLGFVGKGSEGEDKGYFGVEGYYDRLLRGKESYFIEIRDALGRPILSRRNNNSNGTDGSNIILTIDRSIQFLAEEKIKKAIERYGAEGGAIGIIEPQTGNIIAMASFPTFDPQNYAGYDENLYKNYFIANTFEPGSTLKPIIMASALDSGVVTPQTKCPICDKPVSVSGYELHTWNDKYYKDTNMIDVIRHSDNTGMAFVALRLGRDKIIHYLGKFGIGKLTDIDLQGESFASLKPKDSWYDVDLATTGFGQGISVTPIGLLSAFSAIANKGVIMQPRVVAAIEGTDGEITDIPIKIREKPISEKTAKVMTEILVNAVEKGEAQWAKFKGYRIAGKTGTASIPVAGHYDPESTIVSFIGFAPADDPKFAMLVILDKPTTSIYAAETAAPVFFDIAKDLLTYYGIPPSE